MVERLFLAVPRGCLQFVIVVFPDHTHLLFLMYERSCLNPILSHWLAQSSSLDIHNAAIYECILVRLNPLMSPLSIRRLTISEKEHKTMFNLTI